MVTPTSAAHNQNAKPANPTKLFKSFTGRQVLQILSESVQMARTARPAATASR